MVLTCHDLSQLFLMSSRFLQLYSPPNVHSSLPSFSLIRHTSSLFFHPSLHYSVSLLVLLILASALKDSIIIILALSRFFPPSFIDLPRPHDPLGQSFRLLRPILTKKNSNELS
nr:hypothetical protein 68B2.100 [imported] - Neurospora crassa [Neurospora crassa]